MVIAPRNFRDEEYLEPKRILEAGGFSVIAASWEIGTAIGTDGAIAQIDLLINQVLVEDYVAVIFVGGAGMVEQVANPQLTDLAQKFFQQNKITAGICVAAAILANAGLLSGKKATAWDGVAKVLRANGANYTAASVEQDDLLITADGPRSAAAFGQKILDALRAA